jgi:hypothetical protein
MTDADRLIRRHDRQQSKRYAADAAAAERQAEAELAALRREVAAETTAVLRLLKEQGFPEMTGVSITRERFGLKSASLGYKRERVAAWDIGDYPGTMWDVTYTGQIYLLSNGKFMLSGGRSDGGVRELDDVMVTRHLTKVLDGLQALRERLEAAE